MSRMNFFIGIVLFCILPAILCNPSTTQKPRLRRGRTTTIFGVRNDEASNNHRSGAVRRRSSTSKQPSDSSDSMGRDVLVIPEILMTVFDCLSNKDLSNVRDVCRDWRTIVDTNTLRERVNQLSELRIPKDSPLTWQEYLSIYNVVAPQQNLWERSINQAVPNCAESRQPIDESNADSKCWEIIPVDKISEVPNAASKPNNYIKRSLVLQIPKESNVLNLVRLGLPGAYLDLIQPKIEIREWAQHTVVLDRRPGVYARQEMRVKIFLLNKHNEKIKTYERSFRNNPLYHGKWEEKILSLENYGEGVRKILIERECTHMRSGSDIFVLKPERPARASPRRHTKNSSA